MIPKVMNFFWHKGPMSWLRFLTLKSFVVLNPDWKVVLHIFDTDSFLAPWKSPNIQDFQYRWGEDYMKKLSSLLVEVKNWVPEDYMPENMCPSQASNFFKFSHLGKNGGMYADMDILFFRNIGALYEQLKECDVALSYNKYFSVGLLASSLSDVSFYKISIQMSDNFRPNNYQGAWRPTFDRIGNIAEYVGTYGCSVFNIDMRYLYFIDSTRVPDIWKKNRFHEYPDDAIGVHWYAGHPVSQEGNRTITQNNQRKYNNTLTSAMKAFRRAACQLSIV